MTVTIPTSSFNQGDRLIISGCDVTQYNGPSKVITVSGTSVVIPAKPAAAGAIPTRMKVRKVANQYGVKYLDFYQYLNQQPGNNSNVLFIVRKKNPAREPQPLGFRSRKRKS
jgi:hypothetical protein